MYRNRSKIFLLAVLFCVSAHSCTQKHIAPNDLTAADTTLLKQSLSDSKLYENISADAALNNWSRTMAFARQKGSVYAQLYCAYALLKLSSIHDTDRAIRTMLNRLLDSISVLPAKDPEWSFYNYYISFLKGKKLQTDNKFDSASYYLKRSLDLSYGDSDIYFSVIASLAALNFQHENLPSAIRYQRKLIRRQYAIADTVGLIKSLVSLAAFYNGTAHADSTLYYFRQAEQLILSDTPRYITLYINYTYNVAAYYSRLQTYDSSIRYYRKTLALFHTHPFDFRLSIELTKLSLAKVLILQGQMDDAGRLFSEVAATFGKDSQRVEIQDAFYYVGYQLAQHQSDYEKALMYFEHWQNVNENRSNAHARQQLMNLEEHLQQLSAEKTIAEKDVKISRHRQTNVMLGSLALILGILTCAIYRSMAQQQKLAQLNQEKKILQSKIEERERIAREMHDEMGSTVTSMQMALELYKIDPEAPANKARLDHIGHELQTQLNEVIWRLNTGNDFLSNLCAYIYRFAGPFLSTAGLTFKMERDIPDSPIPLSGTVRQSLYLCVKEALNNAVKHSGAKLIKIAVNYRNGNLTLSVTDDGKGIATDTVTKGGNGIVNITKRMEALGGKAVWRVLNGTEMELSLNLSNTP